MRFLFVYKIVPKLYHFFTNLKTWEYFQQAKEIVSFSIIKSGIKIEFKLYITLSLIISASTPIGKSRLLGCGGQFQTIYIKDAWFGNKDRGCTVNAKHNVDYGCSGYVVCPLTADIGVFGDPKCPDGVRPVLFVEYWCGSKGTYAIK